MSGSKNEQLVVFIQSKGLDTNRIT